MSSKSIRRDFAETDFESAKALITWNALVEPGDRVAGELIRTYGPVVALEAFTSKRELGQEVQEAFARWEPRYSKTLADQKIAEAKKNDLKLLLPTDNLWPSALNDLGNHSPLLLWYRGNAEHLESLSRSVGIVGSRNASQYGHRVTSDLTALLVGEQAAVISGGALGIDSVAHRTALSLKGLTVAFMAGALDCPYPVGNLELFDQISHSGLLLSEMSPGARPTRWRFLQRNRLIAALSSATVVTEAGWRSGSINTANHALELGRPVFAIPGPITSPASAGCNRLIRDSQAAILLDLADLPVELGWHQDSAVALAGLGSLELRALDALVPEFQTIEQLLVASGLALSELRVALGALKLLGKVESDGSGAWRLNKVR